MTMIGREHDNPTRNSRFVQQRIDRVQSIESPFHIDLIGAIELIIDGGEPNAIRRALELELNARTESDLAAAQVFRAMGGYAPTIGILGAVLGLIHVMGNLADPSALGPGIATAFVATIYGVGFANLLFLPVADRLKAVALRVADGRALLAEGLLAIAEGEHPRLIEVRLGSYLERV